MADEPKDVQASGGDVSRRSVLVASGAVAAAVMTGGATGAAQEKFEPNKLTFAACIERIRKVAGKPTGKIVTSRDEGMDRILDALRVTNIPAGFTKYQLPVAIEGGPGAQFFVSIGAPNTEVAKHSHNEGDGLRFIVSGSIIYDGKELTSGDWMFIPKGQQYSMKVGKTGATLFYCYSCCCA